MKKRYLEVFLVLIIIICGLFFINRVHKIPLTYLKAIDKIYNSNISGMAVIACKTNNLYGTESEILITEAANKENNFSANDKAGVKLWEAKQLFLSIKDLKVLKEDLPEMLETKEAEYYLIQTNQDYVGERKSPGIYHLTAFINTKNYHIYMPKDYYESNNLPNLAIKYVEYEPNEVTKKLVNDIIALN